MIVGSFDMCSFLKSCVVFFGTQILLLPLTHAENVAHLGMGNETGFYVYTYIYVCTYVIMYYPSIHILSTLIRISI